MRNDDGSEGRFRHLQPGLLASVRVEAREVDDVPLGRVFVTRLPLEHIDHLAVVPFDHFGSAFFQSGAADEMIASAALIWAM